MSLTLYTERNLSFETRSLHKPFYLRKEKQSERTKAQSITITEPNSKRRRLDFRSWRLQDPRLSEEDYWDRPRGPSLWGTIRGRRRWRA